MYVLGKILIIAYHEFENFSTKFENEIPSPLM